MDVRIGLWRKLSAKKLMLLHYGFGEDSWESLGLKEVQLVHPKGDQSWVFTGRTDAKAETPILWPAHGKSWLIGKHPDAVSDWGQDEKGMTEDEMAGWHHWLDGHEFEWTLEIDDGQGGLACCNLWGHKELDMTEWLNWTNWTIFKIFHLVNTRSALIKIIHKLDRKIIENLDLKFEPFKRCTYPFDI